MSPCETHRTCFVIWSRHDAYRRNFVPGGCFFFTFNLAERGLALLTDHVELLRGAFRETHLRHPFTIDAIVVLPDHLHAVWTLPEGDADFAMRWFTVTVHLIPTRSWIVQLTWFSALSP